MSKPCEFCGGPCNPFDKQTWKQVSGWVGGPHKDSMKMRTDSGKYAHDACVKKAQAGIDPKSQPSLEDDGTDTQVRRDPGEQLLYDIFAAPAEEVPRDEPDFSGVKFDSDGPPPF